MNRTLNKVPIYVIFNLYNQTSAYAKQKSLFGFMVFNATFTNISVISWRSVLLMEETGENHWAVVSNRQTLSHKVVSSTPHLSGVRTRNFSGDSTDCTGSFKSNYHMITTTMAPKYFWIEWRVYPQTIGSVSQACCSSTKWTLSSHWNVTCSWH